MSAMRERTRAWTCIGALGVSPEIQCTRSARSSLFSNALDGPTVTRRVKGLTSMTYDRSGVPPTAMPRRWPTVKW